METLDTNQDGTISPAEAAAGADKVARMFAPPPPPPSSSSISGSSSSSSSSGGDLYQSLIDALNKAKDSTTAGSTDTAQSGNPIESILRIFASAIQNYEKNSSATGSASTASDAQASSLSGVYA